MTSIIPDSQLDLLQTPVHGVLTTVMQDGAPQSSIIWVDYDREYVLINTTLEPQKAVISEFVNLHDSNEPNNRPVTNATLSNEI